LPFKCDLQRYSEVGFAGVYGAPVGLSLTPGVALQVAFERQTLKPVFQFIGYRLWVRKVIGYGLWVNLIQPA
jgi:hypothetical protein